MSATCTICQHPMDKKGCIGKLQINGKMYHRIPYGYRGESTDEPCGDCAVKYGQIHHWGCDNESCPVCHGQALGCECGDHYSLIFDKKK